MTELHHFHPAHKGSGSLRPFPIYPLYTQAEILSLDKPIADCFLFRPRKNRKSAGNAVIPTFPTRWSHGLQHLRHKRRTFAFTPESGYTLGFAQRIAHSGLHAETGAVSDRGCYHYPRSVPHVHKHPRAGCQNGKLCRFCALIRCAPEERREPSEQRCAYARRCSEAPRPRRAAQTDTAR